MINKGVIFTLYHMPCSMCVSVSRGSATGFRQVRSRRRLFPAARPHWCTHLSTRPPKCLPVCECVHVFLPFLVPVLSLLLSHKRQYLSSWRPCLPFALVRETLQRETKTPELINQVVCEASLKHLNPHRFVTHPLVLKGTHALNHSLLWTLFTSIYFLSCRIVLRFRCGS